MADTDFVLVPVGALRNVVLTGELLSECEGAYAQLESDYTKCEVLADAFGSAYAIQVKRAQDAIDTATACFVAFLVATTVATISFMVN